MSSDAVTVFFSYSHKDEALRDELAKHLEILKWSGEISAWHDRQILPGDEWDREIKDNLNTAQIILLLISSDFIASSYCRDIEIKRAIERHEAEEACVIPVILRRCMWSAAPFGRLQALPKNASPVTDTNVWPTFDDAFTNIAEGIKKAVDDVRQKLKAVKQAKLRQYEAAYQEAIQQEYPLGDATQNKLNQLQIALGLTETDIASTVTHLLSQYVTAKQKLDQYRDEVRLFLQEDDGEILPQSRTFLDIYKSIFGLTTEEATAVEEEEIAPYRIRANAVEQYSQVFADVLRHEDPVSKSIRQRLRRLQNTLGLKNEDIEKIESAHNSLQNEANKEIGLADTTSETAFQLRRFGHWIKPFSKEGKAYQSPLEEAEAALLRIFIHSPEHRTVILETLESRDLQFSFSHHRTLWQKLRAHPPDSADSIRSWSLKHVTAFAEINETQHLFYYDMATHRDVSRAALVIRGAAAYIEQTLCEKRYRHFLQLWSDSDHEQSIEQKTYYQNQIYAEKRRIAQLVKERQTTFEDL